MRNLKLTLLRFAQKQIYDRLILSPRAPDHVATRADVSYAEDGLAWHRLDVYSPVSPQGNPPAVIYIHGGGWCISDKKHLRYFCQNIAAGGYVVFNINYRLAPDYAHPAQIEDVLAAMRWVRSHAREFGADPERIFLAGDSAGAHLASLAACVCTNSALAGDYGVDAPFTEQELCGCILFCGAYDLRTAGKTSFPLIRDFISALLNNRDIEQDANLDRLSVTGNLTARFPPSLVSDSVRDSLIGESRALIRALEGLGVKHRDLLFEDVGRAPAHDYHIQAGQPIFRRCVQESLDFLKEFSRSKGPVEERIGGGNRMNSDWQRRDNSTGE